MTDEAHPPRVGPAIDPVRLQAPLVEVVAPAGYGKTTLLGEWAAHSVDPVLWVSVDRHMDDPAGRYAWSQSRAP